MNFLGRLGVPAVPKDIDWDSEEIDQAVPWLAPKPDATTIDMLPTASIAFGPGRAAAAHDRLIQSIGMHGVLVPLLLRPGSDGAMVVVDGNKRLAAAHALKLEAIPAVVRELDDATALLLGGWQLLNEGNLLPAEAEIAHRALDAAGLGASEAKRFTHQGRGDAALLSAEVCRHSPYHPAPANNGGEDADAG
jgi:ParB/Sulfiredoxin domain